MPRTYIPKLGSRSYRNYTSDNLEEAVSKVSENKLSIKQASERYKIPYGTLHNKFHGKHTGLSDILTILPEPKAEQSGDRLRYTFEKKIDAGYN